MEKEDHKPADKFIDALIKSLQSLCHGYLDFQKGVEIIGYINLSVDKENSVDCVLKERVCKTAENATSFISNSFHAKPEEVSTENEQSGNQVASSKKSREISSLSSGSVSHLHQSNSKRRASEDHNNDTYFKKSLHLSKVPRLSPKSLHPSISSSSVDSKADLQKMISSGVDASETEHSQSSSKQSKSPEDNDQMKLTGIVLEPVDNDSYGGEDDGDLDVTFIKEEYFEDEALACEFQNPGSQQMSGDHYRTGQNQDSSYCAVSSQSSTSTASSFKAEPSEHIDLSGNSSFQSHPGPSGMRGPSSNQSHPDFENQGPVNTSSVRTHPGGTPEPHSFTQPHSSSGATRVDMNPHPALSSNVSSAADITQSKILLCEYCDASFTSSGGLSLHKATVHLQRRFVCNICGKVLKRKATLINHLYSHKSDNVG